MIRRLAHVCFHTQDLRRLLAFYQERLGFPVKFRFLAQDGSLFGAYLECGAESFIELFDQAGAVHQWGGEAAALFGGNRYLHACFEVTGISDFRDRLLSQGVQVTPIQTGLDGSRIAFLKDPDGNVIELMEYQAQSAQLGPARDAVVQSAR